MHQVDTYKNNLPHCHLLFQPEASSSQLIDSTDRNPNVSVVSLILGMHASLALGGFKMSPNKYFP